MASQQVKESALDALRIFHSESSLFEIRIITKDGIFAGFFSSPESAYDEITKFEQKWKGCYFTLNPVSPEKRKVTNKITKASTSDLTGDVDILSKNWINIDIDPVRIPGVSSTDEEKSYSLEVARNIVRYLSSRGFPSPVVCDSGNGTHLNYRIRGFSIDTDLHHKLLHDLGSKFNSEQVDIDLTIRNPARIWKLYGTLSRKGASSTERPYRYSKILHNPNPIEYLSPQTVMAMFVGPTPNVTKWFYKKEGDNYNLVSKIVEFAGQSKPAYNPPKKMDGGSGVKYDAVSKLREWGYEISSRPKDKAGYTVHELKKCPCGRDETGSALYVSESGGIGFNCKHSSCEYSESDGVNKWDLLRSKHDPKPEKKAPQEKYVEKKYTKAPQQTSDDDGDDVILSLLGKISSEPSDDSTIFLRKKEAKIPEDIYSETKQLLVDVSQDHAILYSKVLNEISKRPDLFISNKRISIVDKANGIMTRLEKGAMYRTAFESCEFVTIKRDRNGIEYQIPATFPIILVESLMEPSESDARKFREVVQVVKSPFFDSNGRFVNEVGYDALTKTYMCECPEIPEVRSSEDAWRFLEDLVSEFPWQDEAEMQNYLSVLITPMVRDMIDGPLPMLVIEANKRGTGKTKLAQMIMVAYGSLPRADGIPQDEDEMDKRLLSTVVEARQVELFDNVVRPLNSASLDRVLTTGYYSGRILGKTQKVHARVLCQFILTSNNTRTSEDMARRFIRARLRTNLSKPSRRTGFKIKNPVAHVKDKRAEILACIARIIKDWIDAGMPEDPNIPTLGSYESWVEVVGSIMYFHGKTKWLSNIDSAVNDALILDEWEAFFIAWYTTIGSTASITRLVTLAEEKHMLGHIVKGDSGNKVSSLKAALASKHDEVVGSYRLRVEKDSHLKTLKYTLDTTDIINAGRQTALITKKKGGRFGDFRQTKNYIDVDGDDDD